MSGDQSITLSAEEDATRQSYKMGSYNTGTNIKPTRNQKQGRQYKFNFSEINQQYQVIMIEMNIPPLLSVMALVHVEKSEIKKKKS